MEPKYLAYFKITQIIFKSQKDFMDSKEEFNW